MNNPIRIAINGFGRIGRLSLRAIFKKTDIEVVAINDLTDTKTLAHLFKYDSAQHTFEGDVKFDENHLIINGKNILVVSEKNPELLPWKILNIDLVLESTGLFTSKSAAEKHLQAGAKKVIISAPCKDDVKTIVLGVNDEQLHSNDLIISNASCTTNCLAPMVKILDDNFGLEKGYMLTVHAMTADQRLMDAPHTDLRRARAASVNIIPTTTGAAKAVTTVIPKLKGKINGNSMRVPVITGSITDFTAVLKKNVSVEEINNVFKSSADNDFKGIVQFSDEPLVSSDIIGNQYSCIFDSLSTMVMDGNFVKVVGWYDNESGYSHRIADLIERMKN
jgi:glyceraldehyde 3-phosphate dehydrogenase